jgi:RNA polymerase sigma factor (sigma-70 family)
MPATVLRLLAAVSTDTPDAELLGRFVADRDGDAFAELVRRHGPATYRVCRRLVGPSSADDAFQAAFLVLACRAKAVRKAASVGSWLIGVAGRVARQMRRSRVRDSGVRIQPDAEAPVSSPNPESRILTTELSAILADELTRLPDTLRDPVVLCLVEGHTQEQAASALGGSVRTLRRRLDRAKAVLRARLERRGIVPTVAAGLVAAVGSETVALPPGLADRAVTGVSEFLAGGGCSPAAAVAKGVVGNMVKLKASVMVAAAVAAVIGLGVGWANDPPAAGPSPPAGLLPPPSQIPGEVLIPPPVTTQPPDGRVDRNVRDAEGTFRTRNFVVHAVSPWVARAVANEAEFQRAGLATQWLRKELPAWEQPCVIRVAITTGPSGGATSMNFRAGNVRLDVGPQMELHGSLDAIMTSCLPHEVMHVVLATHFGKPLPRWAAEGIALCAESATEQTNHDVRVRELLNAGRGIRLKTLFRMTEYPKDTIVLYAQGHSVVRFLLTHPIKPGPEGAEERDGKIVRTWRSVPFAERVVDGEKVLWQASFDPASPHQALVAFVEVGAWKNTPESWDLAAKEVYGFESVDDLERAWMDWLRKPESVLRPKAAPVVPTTPADPERIPPTTLPGGGPKR